MSLILPDDAVVVSRDAPGPGTSPVSLKNRLGWLREWEQAQWKPGQQRQTAGHHPSDPPQTLSEGLAGGHEATAPNAVLMNARQQDGQGMRTDLQTPDRTPHTRQAPQSTAAVFPAPHNNSGSDFGLYGLGLFTPRFPVAAGQQTAGMMAPSSWNMQAFVEWRPYLLHVVQCASGVRVWMRDMQLSESMAREIAASMRNELSSRGMNLLGLTVNGREIWRSTAVGQDATTTYASDPDATINRIY